MPRVKISGGLFACLVAVYISTAQMLFLPAPMSKLAGQEAWLAVLLSGAGGAVIGLFALMVALRHPGLGPAQIARQVAGKWLGGLIGLAYAGLFVLVLSLVLRDILDFSQMVLLPGTPGLVIATLFAGICLYGVWHGLEPMARVSFQVLVALATAVALAPWLEIREYSIKQVDPFLYRGWAALMQATMLGLPWFGESVAAMSLAAHLKQPRQAYRWLLVGIGGGVAMLTVLVAHTMLVFGPNLPDRFIYPIYYMLHLISIAKILERIEIIMVTVWLSGMFVKAGLYLFVAAEAVGQVLGLKSHRGPAVILTATALAGTFAWGTLLNVIYWNSTAGSMVLLLGLEAGIPALLLIASIIRQAVSGRRRGQVHA